MTQRKDDLNWDNPLYNKIHKDRIEKEKKLELDRLKHEYQYGTNEQQELSIYHFLMYLVYKYSPNDEELILEIKKVFESEDGLDVGNARYILEQINLKKDIIRKTKAEDEIIKILFSGRLY